MFEKIGRLAEEAAGKVSLSRRGFLGCLGRGALAAAGVVGGLLALPRSASAGNNTLYLCGCFSGYAGVSWYECGKCSWNAHGCKSKKNSTAVGTC